MAMKDIVNSSAYLVAVITVLLLCAWSIVHTWTKRKDDPLFTDMHMTLTTLASTSAVVLLLAWIHKAGK